MALGYKGFNQTAFARSSATTLARHIEEVEEAMLRNFQMGALLEANGRISYDQGGEGFDWPVQYRNHQVEGNTGETPRNFVRRNLWITPFLEYRGYQVTDAMYMKEFKANKGKEGIVKVYDNFVERLTTSMKQGLGTQYYVDGTLGANSQSWHGLESMFAINGTLNISTGAQRSANAADKVGYPNQTYAGLSTALGNYNGENQAGLIWPEGIADPEFDFWSPLVINVNSTAFAGSNHTWAGQASEVMRYGRIHSERNSSMDGQITNVVLDRSLYMDFLNSIDNKQQLYIQGGEKNTLWSLGFKNVINFDGLAVSYENGVPSQTGYGYNINAIELLSMNEKLLEPEGPEYDIDTQAFKAVVSTLSNMKCKSPRNFFKLAALT